jgi:hypothetical protein
VHQLTTRQRKDVTADLRVVLRCTPGEADPAGLAYRMLAFARDGSNTKLACKCTAGTAPAQAWLALLKVDHSATDKEEMHMVWA